MCKNCIYLNGNDNSAYCNMVEHEIKLSTVKKNKSPIWCPFKRRRFYERCLRLFRKKFEKVVNE